MTTKTPAKTHAPHDPNWRASAACSEVDADLFFPIGANNAAREQAAAAKRVCSGCLVQDTCLQWALENRQDAGVWGGLTEEERYALHRRRGGGYWARRRDVAEHMYETRLDEFRELLTQGLEPREIAEALGTNVQTVNRLLERLEADEAAQGVSA